MGHLTYSRRMWSHMGENELVSEILRIQLRIFRTIIAESIRRDVLSGRSFSSGQESLTLDYLFFSAIPPL